MTRPEENDLDRPEGGEQDRELERLDPKDVVSMVISVTDRWILSMVTS
jgi:hypothetical protein